MIAACVITVILACAFAADDSTFHRILIGCMWLGLMFAFAFPVKAQPPAPQLLEAERERVEPMIVGQDFSPEPSPSAYVPPFTPMPGGAPPEVRCWQPKAYTYPTGTTGIALVPPVWCCYEWRANVLDQRWVFLQCMK